MTNRAVTGRGDYRAGGLWLAAHGTGWEFSTGVCGAAALIKDPPDGLAHGHTAQLRLAQVAYILLISAIKHTHRVALLFKP